MKRRTQTSTERREYNPTQARFFNYMPAHVRDELSPQQRVAIVETILHLQTEDPRILDEIYMERPYPGTAHGQWTTGQRVRRRLGWFLRRLWLASLRQKSERRVRSKMSDYLFLFFMGMLALTIVLLIGLLFYGVKTMLDIDMYSDFHLLQ
ncbi:MAG: hypothetical protein H6981_07745 [Gammaproteobacteria bacterium]|nr:hypothetical protein [Gammaproteobacteria bacterium]MCP5136677.1 hypothetical protein [Gammaproteobacteria bacterium]